jgi:hypothetical protein
MQTKTKIIVSSITILIITIFIFLFYKSKIDVSVIEQNPELIDVPNREDKNSIQSEVNKSQEPQRIEFDTNVPNDFPSNIPIEKGVTVEQSYGLTYEGQKQLSIVFLSYKSVKDNYSLYIDFLSNQNWVISNKYESDKLSSIYSTKENNDINVTISENTSNDHMKSQVSISVLKK